MTRGSGLYGTRLIATALCACVAIPAASEAYAQQEMQVAFDIATTTDYLRVNSDNVGRSALANLTEASLSLDLASGLTGDGGTLFLLGVHTSGDDPAALTGSAHAPSNLAADEDWRLLEAWYEQRFADGKGALLAGIYAVDSEFDAKVSTEVFLNGAFGTGLDWSESGAGGPGIFPETGLGVRLRYALSPSLTVLLAAVDGQPSAGSAVERLRLDRDDGAFLIGEIDYLPVGPAFRRIVLGGWTYTRRQSTLDELAKDHSFGLYAFWEGQLYTSQRAQGPQVKGFLRGGLASETTNPFGHTLTAGLSGTGLIAGRPADVAGIAISRADFSGNLREQAQLRNDGETALEITYAMQLNRKVLLQPVLQYLIDPVDAPDADALVYGLRVSLGL